jgi:hypothetical protein
LSPARPKGEFHRMPDSLGDNGTECKLGFESFFRSVALNFPILADPSVERGSLQDESRGPEETASERDWQAQN